jgi:hypothetical protein
MSAMGNHVRIPLLAAVILSPFLLLFAHTVFCAP